MTRVHGSQEEYVEILSIAVATVFKGITLEDAAGSVGYTSIAIPEHFKTVLCEVIEELPGLCNCKACYRIAAVDRSGKQPHGLTIGGTFFLLQPTITAQLRHAEQIALFACTIGPRPEALATELFQDGDPVKGHFIDTVASIAVERLADELHNCIAVKMETEGLSVTNRYSPGYCGWPLTQQHALFGFIPEEFCGITVSPSALMLPKKSVSGIIGIGAHARREPYLCDQCNNENCSYRNYKIRTQQHDRSSMGNTP